MSSMKILNPLVLAACAGLVFSSAALAGGKNSHKGGDHGPPQQAEKHEESDIAVDLLGVAIGLISGEEREIIKSHIGAGNDRHCPPGLAKKNNGCLPPGISKKYAVGHALPDGTEILDLPDELLRILKPHKGYYYGQVDGDVLLISEATKKVVDAVTLLSAVGD